MDILDNQEIKNLKAQLNKVRAGLGNMTAEVVYEANTAYLLYLMLIEMKEQTALLNKLAGDKPSEVSDDDIIAKALK